jgi:hypothetical protein
MSTKLGEFHNAGRPLSTRRFCDGFRDALAFLSGMTSEQVKVAHRAAWRRRDDKEPEPGDDDAAAVYRDHERVAASRSQFSQLAPFFRGQHGGCGGPARHDCYGASDCCRLRHLRRPRNRNEVQRGGKRSSTRLLGPLRGIRLPNKPGGRREASSELRRHQ